MALWTRRVMPSLLGDHDLHLFNEGTHRRIYDVFGAHPMVEGDTAGVYFAVWAPDAERVSVVRDGNAWQPGVDALQQRGASGIWEGFIPGAVHGERYKFHIASRHAGFQAEKADPVGFWSEAPPQTASIVWNLDHEWGDGAWMAARGGRSERTAPLSIYELHLGSWMRSEGQRGDRLGYRGIATRLADYVEWMGFTHVELMPLMEHPFYGSWGYQVTGYFAPTARYGTPQDFMHLVDVLHQRGIGVILDWVPAHFPTDGHGLGYFDGTHLYEHADPRRGFHPDWTSNIFNFGRNEVKSFLISSASYWIDKFHIDGLRVDGVASMLYRDYSRKAGEWIPAPDGSNRDTEAIAFLQQLNEAIYTTHPGVQMFAEESTAWSGVTRPASMGGLGFGYKWDLGWMHDTLTYMAREPVHRQFHHDEITFRAIYGYTENFVLPLSHDEVVHGKGSLYAKMPGDDWQKRANLRLLYGYQYGLPGKKLLFMGDELGQHGEWHHDGALEWDLTHRPEHQGLQQWVRDLNALYKALPALHRRDVELGGFQWIEGGDRENSVLSFLRWSDRDDDALVAVVCNFTPVPRHDYRIGVPRPGRWREALSSDAAIYGGSGVGNLGAVRATDQPSHGQPYSLAVTAPPLGCVFLVWEPAPGALAGLEAAP
jgi:1,4-alpha-glucan branching enzyme